jgi:hypothetical protein
MRRVGILIFLGMMLLGASWRAVGQDDSTPTPAPTVTPARGAEGDLQDVPILPELDLESVQAIYEHGQEEGNHPNVLTKIGGSNLLSSAFLYPLDYGVYDLGEFTEQLQPTVDFFAGSFGRRSAAAQKGFNAAMLVDTLFADAEMCRIGETPVTCEIRRTQPSVAVVMYSPNDLQHVEADVFRASVDTLVSDLVEAGVIPIMTTFITRPNDYWDKMTEFNLIVVDIAEEYGVPLVNLWMAAQTLPEMGVQSDNVHYTYAGTLDLNGDQAERGHTLWSFLTLQVLDELRRETPMTLPEG